MMDDAKQRVQIAEVVLSLRGLVRKLREIEKNDSYQGVWSYAWTHGATYSGPSWELELFAAEALLRRLDEEYGE